MAEDCVHQWRFAYSFKQYTGRGVTDSRDAFYCTLCLERKSLPHDR